MRKHEGSGLFGRGVHIYVTYIYLNHLFSASVTPGQVEGRVLLAQKRGFLIMSMPQQRSNKNTAESNFEQR